MPGPTRRRSPTKREQTVINNKGAARHEISEKRGLAAQRTKRPPTPKGYGTTSDPATVAWFKREKRKMAIKARIRRRVS